MQPIIIESCVSTLEEAITAERNGANRLELCARLDLDGLTPDTKLVTQVTNAVHIPVKVMIRNRSGDFIYSSEDMQEILADIDLMKDCKVNHFVFGSMMDNKSLDLAQLDQVLDHITTDNYPTDSLTIHKAIDTSQDILKDVTRLLESDIYQKAVSKGIQLCILTSGGASTALIGSPVIRQMLHLADDRIEVIAAGTITSNNLNQVIASIRGISYHGRRIVPLYNIN